MKKIIDLKDLFIVQLKEQYNGERQQLDQLPKLSGKAFSKDLHDILGEYLGRVRHQIQRLENIFDTMQLNPHGEENKAIKGLFEEANDIANRCADNEIMDTGLVTSVQHILHHDMASYGTLRTYAEELGMDEIAENLEKSLEEEDLTDQELSGIAEVNVNLKAIHPENAPKH